MQYPTMLPRTSCNVCLKTTGSGFSTLDELASEKQLLNRVTPGLVAR